MKLLFIVLLWLICPLVIAGATSSQNIIVLKESSPIQTNKGLIWRDESENATIDQVIKRLDEFKPVSELLNSKNENKSGTYWALATFKNDLNHDYLMRLGGLDGDSSVYIVEQDGEITSVKIQPNRKYNEFADINPEIEHEISSVSRFTLTQIRKGNQITIISKHINYTIRQNDFPIQYWDHVKFLEWSRFNIYFQGFLLGLFIALSVFTFYYAYINKDSASFVYALWLLLAVIGILITQLYGGDKLSEFFINDKDINSSDLFVGFLQYNLGLLSSYLFLIFGIISLNIRNNFPTVYKLLVGLIIYSVCLDAAIFIIDFNKSELIIYIAKFVWYISTAPNLIMHITFIITSLILMSRGFKLAFPLFLAALVHASAYVIPALFSVEVVNALPRGLSFLYPELLPYLCSSVQALIMACSIVTRIRYMQDQLNFKTEAHRVFVEDQNRVLEKTVAERTQDLKLEAQKSERLMLNILPQSIATRLKAGDEGISDSYQNATILFSDLVGFTKMSSSKTAEELVFLLNDLFKRFDTRATSLGLEKIKTIGDAYMVAGGLPTNDDEHAIRVTKMALGMYEDLDAFNKEHGMELDMRIGINSGPVVAGVIGHSKFSYDLWGNTVNTASRMESTCLPGKVQVSPSTYEQIKGHFDVQENQMIECKGLGQIMTYFVK
jgi:class 3 adenylate cyclase